MFIAESGNSCHCGFCSTASECISWHLFGSQTVLSPDNFMSSASTAELFPAVGTMRRQFISFLGLAVVKIGGQTEQKVYSAEDVEGGRSIRCHLYPQPLGGLCLRPVQVR